MTCQPVDARIPCNPRYEHIGTTLDTGASMSKYLARLEDLRSSMLNACLPHNC